MRQTIKIWSPCMYTTIKSNQMNCDSHRIFPFLVVNQRVHTDGHKRTRQPAHRHTELNVKKLSQQKKNGGSSEAFLRSQASGTETRNTKAFFFHVDYN